ncbi:hypothetical protein [Xylanimonas sp. McL0601]|uniref:hypothetical protein n=1 Tax=Xylanimonas sp. McL0601 TaxID=3414739 RepID=UPI003CF92BDD
MREKAADLQKQLDDLIQTGIADASDTVRTRWETQEVQRARQEIWEAQRRRDAAERALLTVYQLHHPSREHSGRCTCGQVESDCRVRYALQPLDKRLERLERTFRDTRPF